MSENIQAQPTRIKVEPEFVPFIKAVTATILDYIKSNELTIEFCITKFDQFSLESVDEFRDLWKSVIIHLSGNHPNLTSQTLEHVFDLTLKLHTDAKRSSSIKVYPDFIRTFINTRDKETQEALKEGFYKKALANDLKDHPLVSSLKETASAPSKSPIEIELESKIIHLEKNNSLLFEQNQKLELEIKEMTILLQLAEGEINKLRYRSCIMDNVKKNAISKVKLNENNQNSVSEDESPNLKSGLRLRDEEGKNSHDVYHEIIRKQREQTENIDEKISRREKDSTRLKSIEPVLPEDFSKADHSIATTEANQDLKNSWGETLAIFEEDVKIKSIVKTINNLKDERAIKNHSPYFGYLNHIPFAHKNSPFAYTIPWEDIRSEVIAELIKVITDSNFKIKGNINESVVYDPALKGLQIKYGVGKHEQKDRLIRLFEVNNGIGIDFNNKLVKNENIKVFMLCARACNRVLNADLLSNDPMGQKGNVVVLCGPAKGKAEIGSICKMVLAAQAFNLKPVLLPNYYDEQEISDIKETLAQNEFLIKYRSMFGYPDISFLKIEKSFRISTFG